MNAVAIRIASDAGEISWTFPAVQPVRPWCKSCGAWLDETAGHKPDCALLAEQPSTESEAASE